MLNDSRFQPASATCKAIIMTTGRAPPWPADDDFSCSNSSTLRSSTYPTHTTSRPWRSPPHPCDIVNSSESGSSYLFDNSAAQDLRAKSTPPSDLPRRVPPYPSPPLTDAALASTVPLPPVCDTPGHPPIGIVHRPDQEDFVDENMSHDDARHLTPLSPPPTVLVGTTELPFATESSSGGNQVEVWRYGRGLKEDGSASAPQFPPVRDDSGYEECDMQGSCEDSQKHDDSHPGTSLIEPTSVWTPHSPLSFDESLPLVDLPSLHTVLDPGPCFARDSAQEDRLVSPHSAFSDGESHSDSWASRSDMEWSPSTTFAGDLSAPQSPKSFLTPELEHPPVDLFHPAPFHPSASFDEIYYHQRDPDWFSGHSYGAPQLKPLAEDHSPFLSTFRHLALRPPSADLDSDNTDTVMPPDEDDYSTLFLPPSPRRRLNDLLDAILPHEDLCLTPIPHSPHRSSLALPELEMEDLPEEQPSPRSPLLALPTLDDEELPCHFEQSSEPPVDTIAPSLLSGSPGSEKRVGLGLFMQPVSDLPLARSPSPDEDDFGFLDVQLDPESVNVEVDEFLQLRALRKNALAQERAARMAEADYTERITAMATSLLPPTQTGSDQEPEFDAEADTVMRDDADSAEKRLRKRELHSMMDLRAEARRTRKQQKQRSKEIGALLDFKMHGPVSPMQDLPPLATGKGWTRSIAHLVAHMIMRRRDRARPLDSKAAGTPDMYMRRESYLRRSVSADDLLAAVDADGEDDDMEM